MKIIDQRVAVLVDVQNMFYSAKNKYNAKLDFEKLLDTVVLGRKLIRAIAYIVQTRDIDQSGFINLLKNKGFEVKSKILKQRADGSAKGDWDMGLAIDAISIAHKVDAIALVSGDGDFTDLVNHLKASGVRVEVHSFMTSTAEELINSATEYFALDENLLMPFKK
ncbi:MAG TPA: NYN domain-containing protein [bacterium]|nr:NYN domain-containing protein [bacterium]HPN30113.1 NYN domain-containing protein [bacterium]